MGLQKTLLCENVRKQHSVLAYSMIAIYPLLPFSYSVYNFCFHWILYISITFVRQCLQSLSTPVKSVA